VYVPKMAKSKRDNMQSCSSKAFPFLHVDPVLTVFISCGIAELVASPAHPRQTSFPRPKGEGGEEDV